MAVNNKYEPKKLFLLNSTWNFLIWSVTALQLLMPLINLPDIIINKYTVYTFFCSQDCKDILKHVQ